MTFFLPHKKAAVKCSLNGNCGQGQGVYGQHIDRSFGRPLKEDKG